MTVKLRVSDLPPIPSSGRAHRTAIVPLVHRRSSSGRIIVVSVRGVTDDRCGVDCDGVCTGSMVHCEFHTLECHSDSHAVFHCVVRSTQPCVYSHACVSSPCFV
jgi:hypothetical protein